MIKIPTSFICFFKQHDSSYYLLFKHLFRVLWWNMTHHQIDLHFGKILPKCSLALQFNFTWCYIYRKKTWPLVNLKRKKGSLRRVGYEHCNAHWLFSKALSTARLYFDCVLNFLNSNFQNQNLRLWKLFRLCKAISAVY